MFEPWRKSEQSAKIIMNEKGVRKHKKMKINNQKHNVWLSSEEMR